MTHDLLYLLITLSSGVGIGTMISALIKRNHENRKLLFETRLIKYGNLIEALQNSVSDSSEKAKQMVVSAQMQVALVGTQEIASLSRELFSRDVNFCKVRDALVTLMQKDLKKYYD